MLLAVEHGVGELDAASLGQQQAQCRPQEGPTAVANHGGQRDVTSRGHQSVDYAANAVTHIHQPKTFLSLKEQKEGNDADDLRVRKWVIF